MMKKAWMVLAGFVVLAAAAAGSFWAGMTYQANRAEQIRANFMSARGVGESGQFPGSSPLNGGLLPGGAPSFGGGAQGVVKSVEGNVVQISTAQDVTTVVLSADTQIFKSVAGASADLQPGVRVTVTGGRDESGAIAAARVTILDQEETGPAVPPQAGKEP
jgi:hypothetical protein